MARNVPTADNGGSTFRSGMPNSSYNNNNMFNNPPNLNSNTNRANINRNSTYNTTRNNPLASQSSIGRTLDEKGYNKNRFPRVMYPNRRDLCFFHQVFGHLARRCELKGCKWMQLNNNNNANNARYQNPYNNQFNRQYSPNFNVQNRSKN